MAVVPQTNSRIADASISWEGSCDEDITGWDKTKEFVCANFATDNTPHSGTNNNTFKMQWRRAAGTFADVGEDTEICWGTDTDLVNNNIIGTHPSECITPVQFVQETEGDNLLTQVTKIDSGNTMEMQWALGFGSGAQDNQEYELQLVSITDSLTAICSCSITTAEGAPVEFEWGGILKYYNGESWIECPSSNFKIYRNDPSMSAPGWFPIRFQG